MDSGLGQPLLKEKNEEFAWICAGKNVFLNLIYVSFLLQKLCEHEF